MRKAAAAEKEAAIRASAETAHSDLAWGPAFSPSQGKICGQPVKQSLLVVRTESRGVLINWEGGDSWRWQQEWSLSDASFKEQQAKKKSIGLL